LEVNLRVTADRQAIGIGGRFNRANNGAIARFGWKAQIQTLRRFAAEAQCLEIGVANGVFGHRDDGSGCVDVNIRSYDAARKRSSGSSDLDALTAFMRLSAPPTPTTHTASELSGRELFVQVGCHLCHSPSLKTGESTNAKLSHVAVHAYSDFALHHMGPGLNDHVSQGLAVGDEFRTAPLWGLGQRIFFLHDGRTTDLQEAILAHSSTNERCQTGPGNGDEACVSEANRVIVNFKSLSEDQKQELLDFLRSL
jgi:CxxC motif-containing protein (DUF1111 family)